MFDLAWPSTCLGRGLWHKLPGARVYPAACLQGGKWQFNYL